MTYFVVVTPNSGCYIEQSHTDAENIAKFYPGSHIRIFRTYKDAISHLSSARCTSPSLDKRLRSVKGYCLVTINGSIAEFTTEDDTLTVLPLAAKGHDLLSEAMKVKECLAYSRERLYILSHRSDLVEIFNSQERYNLHQKLRDLFHELSTRGCALSSKHPLIT